MDLVAQSKIAEIACVTRQAVCDAVRRGILVKVKKNGKGSGKIDLTAKSTIEYIKATNIQRDKSTKNREKKELPDNLRQQKNSIISNNDDSGNISEDLGSLSTASANRFKVIQQVRKLRVETDEKRKVLISREEVQKVFSKLYMIDVNQWRTLGPNLSPDIASIVGTDDNEIMLEISNAIDKEVFTILKQVKRIFNDFLKEQKAEEIK